MRVRENVPPAPRPSSRKQRSTAVHAARRATSGPAVALPHLGQIQRSFGRHDVSGVLAHTAGSGHAEVMAFAAEIKATTVTTKHGGMPMANWMNANPDWRLFAGFFENWMTNAPFPRVKGVTM